MRAAKTEPSGLAAAKHLLQALTTEPEALSGARLRAAFAERVVDHPTLELLDRLVERRARARRLPGLPDAIGQVLGADRPAAVGERGDVLGPLAERGAGSETRRGGNRGPCESDRP